MCIVSMMCVMCIIEYDVCYVYYYNTHHPRNTIIHNNTHNTQNTQNTHHPHTAQEWTNRTVIGHELLICSKMCFTKTELVQ